MKYSIVIPTYNNCDKYLKPCIDSIFKWTDMAQIELIISANGCTDNTFWYLDSLKRQFDALGFSKHLKLVWDDKPLGYAKATNEGIKVSTCEKIVLLNNDTVFLEQEKDYWLKLFEQPFAKYPKCGISCIIKGTSEPAGRDFAVFFCVMVHRKVFDTIGLLNEEYGVGGGEDTEFCIEAEEAGFEVQEVLDKEWIGIQYSGGFPIYHKGEGTMHDPNLVQGWDEIFIRNSLKLEKKYKDKEEKESLRWLCDNGIEAEELYKEVIEENIYKISKKNLKNRSVIDVGANMGTFSLFASKLGAAKVIAVEPVSSTIDVLKNNIEKAMADNIVVMQKIVSGASGDKVKISLQEKCGHNSVYMQSDNYEEIETISLHNLVEMVDGNDIFLKMDCEGGEFDILLNANSVDMDRISTVAIELHGDLHPTYKDIEIVRQVLKSFGYTQTDKKQIGTWMIDDFGNICNYQDLPLTQEIWERV